MERQRRATAGKRLTFLTGQAAENDDAFWGHETWKEDSDEGNESFHSSDEDSELQRDEFDSDFDESESDHEAEEEEAGAAEEQELLESERKKKKRKGTYMEISSAGRNLLVKQQPMAKRTKYTKGNRAIGDGLNAGIVLNLPPPPSAAATAAGVAGPSAVAGVALKPAPIATNQQQLPLTSVASIGAGTGTVGPKHSPTRAKSTGATATLAATRKRRNATSAYGPRERAVKQTVDNSKPKASPTASASGATKKKQPKETHSQEDLIVEAVQETEPENLRWLLGRKRYQAEKDKEATPRETRGSGHTVVEKFVSRRGYPNTITFPNMDHVPALLVPKKPEAAAAKQKQPPKKCVITGKAARYRDPKTGMGYHDAAAFKELRRRHTAKEPLDQRKKKPPPKNAAAASASFAAAAAVNGGGSTADKAPAFSSSAAAIGGAVTSPAHNLSNASSKSASVAKTGNGNAAANGGNITDAADLATTKAAASAGPTVAMPHGDAPVASASPANPKPLPPTGDMSTHTKEAPSPSAAAASSTATVVDVNLAPGRRSPRRRKPSAKVLEGSKSVGSQPILPSLTAPGAPAATFSATTTSSTTTNNNNTNSVEEESAALTTVLPPKPDEEQKV